MCGQSGRGFACHCQIFKSIQINIDDILRGILHLYRCNRELSFVRRKQRLKPKLQIPLHTIFLFFLLVSFAPVQSQHKTPSLFQFGTSTSQFFPLFAEVEMTAHLLWVFNSETDVIQWGQPNHSLSLQ